MNLLLSENHGEIRGRIPARFWPPGLLLPDENHGENRGRIVPRFWPPGILLLGENLGEICGRIPPRSRSLFYKGMIPHSTKKVVHKKIYTSRMKKGPHIINPFTPKSDLKDFTLSNNR